MSNIHLLTDREKARENLRTLEERCLEEQPERLNGLMNAAYIDCDPEKRSVYMEYTVADWELNIADVLHGGIICAMLDHTAGAAIISFTGRRQPTVDMTVSFVRPAEIGRVLACESVILSAGRTLFHIEVKLTDKETGKLIASALVTYANL